MSMARALLVDLDGVIRSWRSQADLDREREFGLPPGVIRRIAFAPERLMPAITGKSAALYARSKPDLFRPQSSR